MNTLDFILLGIIGLFTLWGLFRGLFKEVVSTLGIGLAYWVSNVYHGQLAPFFSHWMKDPAIMNATAYLALFVGANLAVMVVAWVLARAFRLTPPALIEFLGGALFGSAKGALICCVVLICLAAFLPKAEFVQRSVVGAYLKPVTQWLAQYMPERMRNFDPSVLGSRLDKEKSQYVKDFLGGSGKKDDKGTQSDADRMESIMKNIEQQAGKIQDLLDQKKK